jgi:hypothetical protein
MAAKVQVGICKMRSLIVVVDPKHFDKPSARYIPRSPYSIERQFDPLLSLDLIYSFKLRIKVIMNWWHYADVDARQLPTICAQLKRVLQRFKEKGVNVATEFEFEYTTYSTYPAPDNGSLDCAPPNTNLRVQYVGSLRCPPYCRVFHPIGGQQAKRLLDATNFEWADYLRKEVGFERCVILE